MDERLRQPFGQLTRPVQGLDLAGEGEVARARARRAVPRRHGGRSRRRCLRRGRHPARGARRSCARPRPPSAWSYCRRTFAARTSTGDSPASSKPPRAKVRRGGSAPACAAATRSGSISSPTTRTSGPHAAAGAPPARPWSPASRRSRGRPPAGRRPQRSSGAEPRGDPVVHTPQPIRVGRARASAARARVPGRRPDAACVPACAGRVVRVDLAELTTLRLGGPAASRRRGDHVRRSWSTPSRGRRCRRALLIVGGGSNLVVADEGWPGVVVLVRTSGVTWAGDEVTVAAGVVWDDLVATTVARRLVRIGGDVRHSRADRRHAGAERRCVRQRGRATSSRR